jgi:hypothetical protein
MTTSAVAPRLNGTSVVPTEVLREAGFLQQLLQIRDDVFASKHPRIHLPAKVIEQVAPRLPQTAPLTRPATNGAPNGISSSQLFPSRSDSSLQAPPITNEFVAPVPPTQRPYSAVSTSSGIDPVLLTKSDHLIRAELQLKRQQIERLLKEKFDKKGRSNDPDERDIHLNVEECLIQAQLQVPPVSGIRSTTNNSDGAESFDENSYYSSKADSWSSEEVDPKHITNADLAEPLTSQAKHLMNVGAQSRPFQVQPAVIDLDEEAYEPADDIEIYEPEPSNLLEDAEEEDYSPPPADIVSNEPSRGRGRDRGNQNHSGTNGYDIMNFFSLSFSHTLSHCGLLWADWAFELMHWPQAFTTLAPGLLQWCSRCVCSPTQPTNRMQSSDLEPINHGISVYECDNANYSTARPDVTAQLELLPHCKTHASAEERRRSSDNSNNNNNSSSSSSSKRTNDLSALLNHTLKKNPSRLRLSQPTLTRNQARDAPCNPYPMMRM